MALHLMLNLDIYKKADIAKITGLICKGNQNGEGALPWNFSSLRELGHEHTTVSFKEGFLHSLRKTNI